MARKFRTGTGTLNQPRIHQDNFTILDNDESWNVVEEGNQIDSSTNTRKPTRPAVDDELFKYYLGPIGDYLVTTVKASEHDGFTDVNYTPAFVNQQLVVKLPDYGYRNTGVTYQPFSRFQMKDGKVGVFVSLQTSNIILPDIFAEPRFFISPLLNKTPMELIKNPFKGLDVTHGIKVGSKEQQLSGTNKGRNITNDQMTYVLGRHFPQHLYDIHQYYPVGENSYIRFTNIFTFQAEGDVYFFKENKFHKLKMVNGIQCGSIFNPVLETDPEDPYGLTGLSKEMITGLIAESEYLRRSKIEDITLAANEEKYRSLLASTDSTKTNTFAYRDMNSSDPIGTAISRDCLVLVEDKEFYTQRKEGFVVRTLLTKRGRNPETQLFAVAASQKHIFIDELGLIPVNNGKVVVDLEAETVTISGLVLNSDALQITPGTYKVSDTKKVDSLNKFIMNNDRNARWFVPMDRSSLEFPVWRSDGYPVGQKLHYVPNERWTTINEETKQITMLPMEFNYGMWKKFVRVSSSENAGRLLLNDPQAVFRDSGFNLTSIIERNNPNFGTTEEIDIEWYPWKFRNKFNTFMPLFNLSNALINPTYFIKTQGVRFNVAVSQHNATNVVGFAEAKYRSIWYFVRRLEFVLDTTPMVEDEQTGAVLVNGKECVTSTIAKDSALDAAIRSIFKNKTVKPFSEEERFYFQFQIPAPEGVSYPEGHYENTLFLHKFLERKGFFSGTNQVVRITEDFLPDPRFDYRAYLAGENPGLNEEAVDSIGEERIKRRPLVSIPDNQLPFLWFVINHIPNLNACFDSQILNRLAKRYRLNEPTEGTIRGYQFGLDRPHHEWAYALINKTLDTMPTKDEDIPRTFSYYQNGGDTLKRVEKLSPKNIEKQIELFGRELLPTEWRDIYDSTYGGEDIGSVDAETARFSPALYLQEDLVDGDRLFTAVADTRFRIFNRSGTEVGFQQAPNVGLVGKKDGYHLITLKNELRVTVNNNLTYTIPPGDYKISPESSKVSRLFYLKAGRLPHQVTLVAGTRTSVPVAGREYQTSTVTHPSLGQYRPPLVSLIKEEREFNNNTFKIFGAYWETRRGFFVKNVGDADPVYASTATTRTINRNLPHLVWTGNPETSTFVYPYTNVYKITPSLTETSGSYEVTGKAKTLIHRRPSGGTFSKDGVQSFAFLYDERGLIIKPGATLKAVKEKDPNAFLPPYYLFTDRTVDTDESKGFYIGANQVAYFRKTMMTDALIPDGSHPYKTSSLFGSTVTNQEPLVSFPAVLTFNTQGAVEPEQAKKIFNLYTCSPAYYAKVYAENKDLNNCTRRIEPTREGDTTKVYFYPMDSGYYVTEFVDLTGLTCQSTALGDSEANTKAGKVRYVDDGVKQSGTPRIANALWLSPMGGFQTGSGFIMDVEMRRNRIAHISFAEHVARMKRYGVNLSQANVSSLVPVEDYWDIYKGRK